MARTTRRGPTHPYFRAPTPPAHPRPTPIPFDEPCCFAELYTGLTAQRLDSESAVILVPKDYNGDDSSDEYWRQQAESSECFKTCIAYEQIGESHPHLVPYLQRDAWTGLPVLARPSGPPLTDFLLQHRKKMYPSDSESTPATISSPYRPLVLQWALQLLSGLRFVHSHGIIFGDLNPSVCWLNSNMSVALVGFVSAQFRDSYDVLHLGSTHSGDLFRLSEMQRRVSVKSDLFDWANLVFQLMTNRTPVGPEQPLNTVVAQIARREFPALSHELMGNVVRKCWMQEYESVDNVNRDVEVYLQEHGYEIVKNHLKEFDPSSITSIQTREWGI